MKSFDGNVKLKDLQLPSDNDNGINFEATTQLNNPRYVRPPFHAPAPLTTIAHSTSTSAPSSSRSATTA